MFTISRLEPGEKKKLDSYLAQFAITEITEISQVASSSLIKPISWFLRLENKTANMSKMFDPFLHQWYQVSNNDPIDVLLRHRENSPNLPLLKLFK